MGTTVCWISIVVGIAIAAIALYLKENKMISGIVAVIAYTIALALAGNGIWHLLETIDQPQPLPVPTTTLSPPTPASILKSNEGTSTAGTMLRDVQYNSRGRIILATEKVGDMWISWKSVYSDSGIFQYGMRNIGNARSTLTDEYMNGKDTTYSVLDKTIENCDCFTLSYSVSEVRKGNFEGEREVYVSQNTSAWERVGTFDYNNLSSFQAHFCCYCLSRRKKSARHKITILQRARVIPFSPRGSSRRS